MTATARPDVDPTPLPGRRVPVAAPPAHRRAGVWSGPVAHTADTGSGDPLWWWVGAHGGAGVSALTAVLRCSADADRRWPSAVWGECPNAVVVARTHLDGLHHAQDLAAQHAAGLVPPGVRLLGLVTVPAVPGRLPSTLRRMRDLASAAFPAAWHLPWVQQWPLTARDALPGFNPEFDPAPARADGVPPAYAGCGREITATVLGCSASALPVGPVPDGFTHAPARPGHGVSHPGVRTTSKEN